MKNNNGHEMPRPRSYCFFLYLPLLATIFSEYIVFTIMNYLCYNNSIEHGHAITSKWLEKKGIQLYK